MTSSRRGRRARRLRATELPGRRVFVIGGSMGIGLAAATRFAQAGAHVTIFARRPAPLDRALAVLEGARRDPAQRFARHALDAADAAAVAGTMRLLVAEAGPPEVLLNCAGAARPARFEDLGPDAFEDTLRANLHTCWHVARALVPPMRAAGRGWIVHTASLAGLIGVYGYTDYCAAKFGVVGFSEALRSELAPHGVHVAVLCPPDTDTPGFAVENATKPPETAALSAGARVLGADQVAAALLAGLARGRFLIVPGRAAAALALVARLAPGLARRVSDRIVARVRP
jgi:3-dehydrosphinganine reductase